MTTDIDPLDAAAHLRLDDLFAMSIDNLSIEAQVEATELVLGALSRWCDLGVIVYRNDSGSGYYRPAVPAGDAR